jgi:hypothetical protein
MNYSVNPLSVVELSLHVKQILSEVCSSKFVDQPEVCSVLDTIKKGRDVVPSSRALTLKVIITEDSLGDADLKLNTARVTFLRELLHRHFLPCGNMLAQPDDRCTSFAQHADLLIA